MEKGGRRAGRGSLLRAEQAVAGVAQARHDVAVVVELEVNGGGEDRHIGVLGPQGRDAFGRGDQADILQGARPRTLRRWSAAIAELAVASIGSTTITSRSGMSSGTLK